jgi:hypothetical protein
MQTLKQLLVGGLTLIASAVIAQHDVQLPLQYGIQQMISNPAMLQDHKISIALPSVSSGFFTPISVNDAGEIRNGTLIIDPDQFILRLEERGNDMSFNSTVETFAFNFRHKGWQVGVSHRARIQGNLDLPRGLVQLAAYGNARYVGQELQLAPNINATAYQEIGINGAYTFHENFTVGARVKYLLGSAAFTTTTANASLYTDPDFYETTVTSNVTFKTSGFPVDITEEGISIGDLDGYSGAGNGWGVDFGGVYRTEKMEVGLSVRDLGFITWKDNAQVHRSNGEYTFSGYQGNIFNDDGFEFDVEGTIDTIVGELEFATTEQQFTTKTPATVQGTFRYELAKKTTLNATMYAANANSWHTGFGVGLGQQVGKFLHVGALAGMKRGGGYLGANLLLDLWGPQFYIACDNVLSAANLTDANDSYFRAGINLTFGQIKRSRTVKGWYDTKVEGINK